MSKTFALTTPPMGGPGHRTDRQHIAAFQKMLKKRGYYGGAIDGVYGTATAAAVYHAKFDLGYPKPDHAAGDLLYGYLSGKAVPTSMAAIAMRRKTAKNKLTPVEDLAHKALDWYIKNNGKKESPPNSNHSFVTEWYGVTGPWCAMTGVMAYAQSGSKSVTKLLAHKYNWAYVPNIAHDARLGLHGLKACKSADLKPGYGICYDWPGETPGVPDHFGVFEKWISKSAGTFYAREGNTAVGNDSDGGEIMQRERSVSEIHTCVIIGG